MYGSAVKVDGTIELCKIGDIFYRIGSMATGNITKIVITDIKHYPHCVYKDNQHHSYFNRTLLATCFKTEEEAKQELQKRKAITEKRKRLKEYEKLLNEKLGIENHYILK